MATDSSNIFNAKVELSKNYSDCLMFCNCCCPLQLSGSQSEYYRRGLLHSIHWNEYSFVKRRLALVNRRGSILFHDNARSQVARMTLHKFTVLGYRTLPDLAYFPDLSFTIYHFFQVFKHILSYRTLGPMQRGNPFSKIY